MTAAPGPRTRIGAALVTVLLLLVAITLVALSSLRSSALELRMAGNEQERMEAFQTAQAAVDRIFAGAAGLPLAGGPGYTLCTANLSGCDAPSLRLAGPPFSPTADAVRVTRLAPAALPPPRGLESSADRFAVASFRLDGRHDGSTAGGGRAEVHQGYLRLFPLGEQ